MMIGNKLRLQRVFGFFGNTAIIAVAVAVAVAVALVILTAHQMLVPEATLSVPSVAASMDHVVMVVGAGRTGGHRPVSSAKFNYPEAAVRADDGSIYIANSLGMTVERVRGDLIETVLAQTGRTGERINRYNDLLIDGAGDLLVADADGAAIYRVDLQTGTYSLFANAPEDKDVASAYFSISRMDRSGGDLMIVGTTVRPITPSSVTSVGASSIYTRSADGWSHIVDASDVVGEKVSFRDAAFASDGGFAAIVGEHFMLLSPKGDVVRSIPIGSRYGGGILQDQEGWIVGAHTKLLRVSKDLSSSEQIPIHGEIANIANISDAGEGHVLITDSDSQSVFLVDLVSGEVLRQIGNTSGATKVVDLAEGPDGTVLMLENAAPRIIRYDPKSGKTDVVAGNGRQAYSDPAAAKDFSFHYPNGIDVGPDGAIYVTESNYRIVRIMGGQATIFAGDIHPGIPEEGQHRSSARFGSLYGIEVDDQSRVWVVDQGNNTVWRIEVDGTLTRIMGTGEPGRWKEGEPASTQPLRSPNDVLVRPDGSVLISDTYNSVIVEIGPDGIARRFAGRFKTLGYQGYGAFSGDGGPATEADFNTPLALTEGPDGSVYIMDTFNNRVPSVRPDGIISTVAGGGFGLSTDASRLNHATSVKVAGNQLYIADTGNSAVWEVPLP